MQILNLNYTSGEQEGGVRFDEPFDMERSRVTRADVIVNGHRKALDFSPPITLAELIELTECDFGA